MILQLANHCSIALNQEMLLLLHPFAIYKFSTVLPLIPDTHQYPGLKTTELSHTELEKVLVDTPKTFKLSDLFKD